jgi:hypothetical protein
MLVTHTHTHTGLGTSKAIRLAYAEEMAGRTIIFAQAPSRHHQHTILSAYECMAQPQAGWQPTTKGDLGASFETLSCFGIA